MARLIGSGRALATLIAVAAIIGLLPAIANASTLRTAPAVERACADELLADSTPGVERSAWIASAEGLLTVELRGGSSPDWDLAIFGGGDAIASSSSFTSAEKATALVESGDRLEIQACRRSGPQSTIALRTDLFPMQIPDAPKPSEAITLESVSLDGAGDVAKLERSGFDVTHEVSAGAATVALYSDEERAKLEDRGFDSTTVNPNLVRTDEADRAAEARAAAAPGDSSLPSGREEYRVYDDYTTELKALADSNPSLVRSVEVGRTFENRPIEGVEIAVDVERSDDGRPVYLNFGAHHAREWPSAELPMEFALDLVKRYNDGNPRVVDLLERVRVIVVPVVNVDGFLVSRSFGTSPADDDPNATLPLAAAGQGAYHRKNCRPTAPGDMTPCMARTGQGVDLNRNYGAYWGGPGSSNNPTSQSYRGAAPFSEPEARAVRDFSARLHPTVFITNHTFTEDGKWLRQPGFDASFLPSDSIGAFSPDEEAMKSLGDAMAAANGWVSERGYETLGDITGATEDWNYFAQGTYGYTPEVRGLNFHANYAASVVAEYGGTRDSYLIAGERAARRADHAVIRGTVPPGAKLTLRKRFRTPTCEDATCEEGNGPALTDELRTTLSGPADGTYNWHVNPSGRPLRPGETWTMGCVAAGGSKVSRQVAAARGERVTVNWASRCDPDVPPGNVRPRRCGGRLATIVGTQGADRLRGTAGSDVIVGRGGRDVLRGGGGNDRICGRGGNDTVRGGGGADRLRGGNGRDMVGGGGGRDACRGGRGRDRLRSCP